MDNPTNSKIIKSMRLVLATGERQVIKESEFSEENLKRFCRVSNYLNKDALTYGCVYYEELYTNGKLESWINL